MNTVVKLILRNPLDESQTHDLDILPKDAPIGRKWVDKLKVCIDNKLKIEKNFCWVGWTDSPRNLNLLTTELRKHIAVINAYNDDPNCLWTEKYYITEDYQTHTVITPDLEPNHDLFNRLHHHFEILQGQVWNIADWFKNANNEVRYAIRQLNNFCHEMEILIKQIRSKKYNPDYTNPAAIVAFLNGPREELEPEDHDHFTLQRGAGRVYAGYCQIGKIHWEAFVDGDVHIGEGGVSGLRYISGEVTIDFGHDTAYKKEHQQAISNYAAWLKSNGLSIDDKSLAHGWLHVASIDFSKYGDMSVLEIQNLLSKYLDIYKVQIIEDGVIIHEAEYDYHWNKPNFESEQKAELFPTYKSFCNNTD
jgi:hypothetical protein